jgi:sensor histidine kinase YesM
MHIGYWVTYVLFTFGIIAFSKDKFDLQHNFIGPFLGRIFLGAAYFYLFYYYLVPKFLAKRESKRFLRIAVGFCLLSGPLEFTYYFLTTNADTTVDSLSWQESVVAVLNWLVLFTYYAFMAFVNGMMGAFLRGFITWYDEIHVKEVLMRKNLETELELLKAQLNPHFLFNTLNNIDILMKKMQSRHRSI